MPALQPLVPLCRGASAPGRMLLLLFLACTLGAGPASRPATTQKKPLRYVKLAKETLLYKELDPAAKKIPRYFAGETGLCESNFGLSINFESAKVATSKDGDTHVVVIRPVLQSATITLQVTLWLPKDKDKHIVEHEETHRKITLRIREESAPAFEAALMETARQTYEGRAKGPLGAEQAAKQKVGEQFNAAFTKYYLDRVNKLQDRFDELTQHATRRNPTAEQAMKQVFEENPL